MRGVAATPEGLRYTPDLVNEAEAASLVSTFARWHFDQVRLHGQAAKRGARHFGLKYDFGRRTVAPGEPLPDVLEPLRARAAELAGIPPHAFEETLVLRYPDGAGIGWHRDAPAFGEPIVGVSLGAPCALRFQRRVDGTRQVHELVLEPRSAYSLTGPARWQWEHHIASTPGTRFSVTFRPLR